jgi:formyltetrahydrofolate hydrolase
MTRSRTPPSGLSRTEVENRQMKKAYILTLSCDDRPGLVAAVAGFLRDNGGNILEAQQFDDLDTKRFFMRIKFDLDAAPADQDALSGRFGELAASHNMAWSLRAIDQRKRVLLLVSRFDHCLGDLLYRYRIGELDMEIVGIVSNHPLDALNISMIDHIPFHHLPVYKNDKSKQEAQLRQLIEESGTDLVVLARYMQILSDEMSAYLAGRCINIHQLPARLQGRQALSPGLCEGREDHWRDRALRHRRPRRGADHRPGCRACQPQRQPRRSGAQGPRHRTPRARARGPLPSRGPGAAQWIAHDCVQGLDVSEQFRCSSLGKLNCSRDLRGGAELRSADTGDSDEPSVYGRRDNRAGARRT